MRDICKYEKFSHALTFNSGVSKCFIVIEDFYGQRHLSF